MRHNHAVREIECEEAAVTPAEADIHHLPAAKVQSVMDPRVYRIALGCWIGFLAVFWLTFWMSASARRSVLSTIVRNVKSV